jgi:hypothetical protein
MPFRQNLYPATVRFGQMGGRIVVAYVGCMRHRKKLDIELKQCDAHCLLSSS